VHMARHDAGCVMHLHTLDGTAVSSMKDGLLPLNQTALLVRETLAYHDYEGVALDHDERPRLVADLGDKQTMLLRNHGTLALGTTVAEAFTKMYFLERACSMQVRTLAAGRSALSMPADEVIASGARGPRARRVSLDYNRRRPASPVGAADLSIGCAASGAR